MSYLVNYNIFLIFCLNIKFLLIIINFEYLNKQSYLNYFKKI